MISGHKSKKKNICKADVFLFGARGGSRTRTPLRALAPEASESTNSTTRASGLCSFELISDKRYITMVFPKCQHFFSQVFQKVETAENRPL